MSEDIHFEYEDNHVEYLAQAHWDYVQSVLLVHEIDPKVVDLCGFHYRTAFVHGYKHGQEDMQK